jgi:hypothetical protein
MKLCTFFVHYSLNAIDYGMSFSLDQSDGAMIPFLSRDETQASLEPVNEPPFHVRTVET